MPFDNDKPMKSTTKRTMRDVSHTHPHGDPSLRNLYRRGRVLAVDGGDADAKQKEKQTMKDVDHEPPNGEGAHRVFERGEERTPAEDEAEAETEETEE